ncbi:BREX-1 system adenine-specific DNA-methyltransferase PglX, partial [Escherichia coli]
LIQTDSAEYQLLMRTLKRFVNAKTLGSLIQVPQEEEAELKAFLDALYRLEQEGDFQQKAAAKAFIPFIQQAWILAQRYDAVVANPPYMGGKGMNGELKEFAKNNFPDSKSDLFAMFIERGFLWLKNAGFNSMVTMQSWMFLSSFEKMRENILTNYTIETMVHMDNGVMKIAFGTNATVFRNTNTPSYKGSFSYAENDDINEKGYPEEFPVKNERLKNATASDFKKIPGTPIAYWLHKNVIDCYMRGTPFKDRGFPKVGMQTANNDKFLRYWHEIDYTEFSQQEAIPKWIKYLKGGSYRKWYGNLEYVLRYNRNKHFILAQPNSTLMGLEKLSSPKCTWTDLTSGNFSCRYAPDDTFHDISGHCFYPDRSEQFSLLALANTKLFDYFLSITNASFHFQVGDVGKVPVIEVKDKSSEIAKTLVELSKMDWDNYESSWDFKVNPIICKKHLLISHAFSDLKNENKKLIEKFKLLEEKNNNTHIVAYGLNGLLNYEVELNEVSLICNPSYRYGKNISPEEQQKRELSDTFIELLSFSIGCQMGRYSLDREGLVYAHKGNKGFADLVSEGAYETFPADKDGILPLMDDEWFDDDVTSRVKEFVRTVWGEEHLQENLEFIAESLCLYAIKSKKGESALETIRRYLSTQFWKDHMKMYKKRPIYWLFSSGKEKAFECLVYLHRYNDATLSRMRTEYVVPLLARYQANIDRLNDQLDEASGGEATRLKRERDSLIKKFSELRSYDDRLRHYADMRISIDLDDGVKVNYGKFGDLLADVKAITGNAPEVI